MESNGPEIEFINEYMYELYRSSLTLLSFSFLIFKMGLIMESNSQDCCED